MTLAQTTPSPLTLVCCFGGAASGQCTQSSPNQPGCEFVMAYNCGKAGYSCDPGKGICSRNTAAPPTRATAAEPVTGKIAAR